MQSKTSFFNKALFKKNLSRTWIIGLLYTVLLLIVVPISYLIDIANFDNCYYVEVGYTKGMVLYNHFTYISGARWQCVISIIVVVITFWYLFNRRDNFMMHAFPVSRKSMYITGVLSSFVVTVIPVLLVAVVTTIVSAGVGAGAYDAIWYWAFTAVVSTFLFISIAMFSSMITGQIVIAILFYGIFNALYYLMDLAFRITATLLMFGMGSCMETMQPSVFSPESFIENNCLIKVHEYYDDFGILKKFITSIEGTKYLFIYLAVAIVIYVISYVLYQKKKLETVHDFISVPFIKPIFSVGMSFFISMVAGAMVSGMFNAAGRLSYSTHFMIAIISAIVIGIIIFYATQMMIEKTVRVFSIKRFGWCMVYTAFSLVILLCLRFDAFKVENKVPNANDIAWVGIQSNYTMVFTDEDEINTVVSLHKDFLKDKKELRDINIKYPDVDGNYFTIKYKLKNGKTILRNYSVVDTYSDEVSPEYVAATQPILDFLNSPTMIKEHILGNIWNDCTVTDMTFTTYYYDEKYEDYMSQEEPFYDLSKKEKYQKNQKIYDAFLKDIDEGKVFQSTFAGYGYVDPEIALYNDFNFTISNEKVPYFSDESQYWDYYDTEPEPFYEQGIYPQLTTECSNTLKALKEEGFYTDEEGILTYAEYDRAMGYDVEPEYPEYYDGLDGGVDDYY